MTERVEIYKPMKEYNVYSEKCLARNVLEGISDKWSILIISLLADKTFRFGELKREIGGISAKVLTQSLQKLEKYGFVRRTEYDTLVLKVEYQLTPLGIELSKVLQPITEWTEKNMPIILQTRDSWEKA